MSDDRYRILHVPPRNMKLGLVPIHLYRTIMMVVEAGSMTHAAARLHLTQAAVSAQIDKLESVIGGKVFEQSGSGLKLNARGHVVLDYGRRILTLNDQLLVSAGPRPLPGHLSIGLPAWLRHDLLVNVLKACGRDVEGVETTFHCANVQGLKRDLSDGKLDLAFLCESGQVPGVPVVQWDDALVWVAAPDFKHTPGNPIPLISWYGCLTDRHAAKIFEAQGIPFVISFWSESATSRVAAAEAGYGYTLVNTRSVTRDLVVVEEPFLPLPPQVTSGVYLRAGINRDPFEPVIEAFSKVMAPQPPCENGPTQPFEPARPRKRKRRPAVRKRPGESSAADARQQN